MKEFNNKYATMRHEDFVRILREIVTENASVLLIIPGAYEVFSDHYNNEVLARWEQEQFGESYEFNEGQQ